MKFQCSNCGYVLEQAPSPLPEKCPSCGQACTWLDVSCYIPDCGGPGEGTMDERLYKKKEEKDIS